MKRALITGIAKWEDRCDTCRDTRRSIGHEQNASRMLRLRPARLVSS